MGEVGPLIRTGVLHPLDEIRFEHLSKLLGAQKAETGVADGEERTVGADSQQARRLSVEHRLQALDFCSGIGGRVGTAPMSLRRGSPRNRKRHDIRRGFQRCIHVADSLSLRQVRITLSKSGAGSTLARA